MNESALIIADFFQVSDGNIQLIDSQYFDFRKLYQQNIKNNNKVVFCIRTPYPDVLFRKIVKQVDFIKAAGGLVKDPNGNYLFIKRLGKWDLPKGKLEKGEKMKDAARREVEEECGIRVDHVGRKIESTYHSYILKGRLIIKKTNWYEMQVNTIQHLTPQLEEDITEARWLNRQEFTMVVENTYPLIKKMVNKI